MAEKPKPAARHRHRPSQDLRFTHGPLTRDWEGRTVILIAGGPSLNAGQINTAKAAHWAGEIQAMGVNDAYRIAPWIDTLYAADPPWWDHHIKAVRETYIPVLMTQDEEAARRWGLRWVPGPSGERTRRSHRGLSMDPSFIHYGSHSGFQALNIAVLRGAKRIALLGYDMKQPEGKPAHWFGEHEGPGLIRQRDWTPWIENYDHAAPQLAALGVQVFNCSADTAITAFPRETLSRVLWG